MYLSLRSYPSVGTDAKNLFFHQSSVDKSISHALRVLVPFMVFMRNLSMNAGLALSLSLTYETRASSASLFALPASSMRAKRVRRQSFLFSSRCSNLKMGENKFAIRILLHRAIVRHGQTIIGTEIK